LETLKIKNEDDFNDNNNNSNNTLENDDDDDNRSGNLNQHTKTRSSTANSSTGNLPIGGFRFSKKSNESPAFVQAMSQVKDFMTDVQKGHILLREAKLLMELGDYRTSIDVLNEGINLNPNPSLFNARATCYKV
jgi:hypothetical protein